MDLGRKSCGFDAVHFGLWKLGVSTSQGNFGFPFWKNFGVFVGMKLKVSSRLSCSRGTSSGKDLEITYFVDVLEDDNNLRWGRI
jgi:hypothetical protein